MNRIARAMAVVLLFELGALLLYLPWSNFWEQNYFLTSYPWIRHVMLHPATRGIVSGIGVLDIFLGFGFFQSRPLPARVPPHSNS
jgi:hypothetical protein